MEFPAFLAGVSSIPSGVLPGNQWPFLWASHLSLRGLQYLQDLTKEHEANHNICSLFLQWNK
jgi:hypothetical protein